MAISESELVKLDAHRDSVPADLWKRLLDDVTERVDILVLAGLFFVENPTFAKRLIRKANKGTSVRLIFGHPEHEEASRRSKEERLGAGTVSARIRNAIAFAKPLIGIDGIEIRTHTTTLYNSIFRFDDEMIVNNHVYGLPGAHAPAMHLRQLASGDLFETYVSSYELVWDGATVTDLKEFE